MTEYRIRQLKPDGTLTFPNTYSSTICCAPTFRNREDAERMITLFTESWQHRMETGYFEYMKKITTVREWEMVKPVYVIESRTVTRWEEV